MFHVEHPLPVCARTDPAEICLAEEEFLLLPERMYVSFGEEMEVYRARLPELAAGHEGEYVVIRGQTLLGLYPTFAEAVEAGSAEYDLELFLVKQVRLHEEPIFLPVVAPTHGVVPFA